MRSKSDEATLKCHSLTPRRWPDLEKLFGERGACAGCWCMWWRLPHAEWVKHKGENNRRLFEHLVANGVIAGVLAYAGREPIGWCAIAPRSDYVRLARSRVLKPVDDKPVWSITCFFVARPWRRRGVTVRLIGAATEFARNHGAAIVEGYPIDPKKGQPDAFVYTGLASAFRKAGFVEVARRSPTRPIMRYFSATT